MTRLWKRLHENAEGLPLPKPRDDAFSLMEALMKQVAPTEELVNQLFSLGLAAARMRGCLTPGDFRGNSSEWVVDKFCSGGVESLDDIIVQTMPPGRGDCIYAFDGPMTGRLGDMVDEKLPPDIPHVRKSYYPEDTEGREPTKWSLWMGITISWDGARGKVERFHPEFGTYIVYQPGLGPQEANESLLAFCEKAYRGGLDVEEGSARGALAGEDLEEVLGDVSRRRRMLEAKLEEARTELELFPLMMPLEPESFGEDEVLTGFGAGNIVDEIWLHRGLSMSRYEWQMVIHNFPREAFIGTGVMAERVMDEERPGEWCRVAPSGRAFCNRLRNTPPKKFEHPEDAEIVEMRPEVFAKGVFHVLLGAKTAEKMMPGNGMFWVEYDHTRFCLSMATTETELIRQTMQLHETIRSKVLIITAFLDLPAMRGVLSLRKICNPGSFREGLDNPDGFRQRGQAAQKELEGRLDASKWTREEVEMMDESALESCLARGYIAGAGRFLDMDLTKEQLVDAVTEARGEISRKAQFLLDRATSREDAIIRDLKNKEALQDMTDQEIARLKIAVLRNLAQASVTGDNEREIAKMRKEELVRIVYENRNEISEAAKRERIERELSGGSPLVGEIKNWLTIKEAAVNPAVIVQEIGIPKAPEWADWENLEICHKKSRTGQHLILLRYLGGRKGYQDIQTNWLPISALPMFCRGERPNKECDKLLGILDPRSAGESRRKGRPLKCESRKKTHGSPKNDAERQCIYSLGLKLAELTGLPKRVGGILNSDGTPVFCVKNYPDDRENGIAYNDSMVSLVGTVPYKRETRSKGRSISQQASSKKKLDDMLAQRRAQAEGGDPEAQFRLGETYERGVGEEKDLPQAAAWYEKAAKLGHAEAMYHLGLMYENGRGVKADMATAEKWMMQAAKRKHEEAINWCQGRGEA